MSDVHRKLISNLRNTCI